MERCIRNKFIFQEKANSTGLSSTGSSSQTPPDTYLKTEPKIEQVEELSTAQTSPDLAASPAVAISQPGVITSALIADPAQTSPLTGTSAASLATSSVRI